MATLPPAAIRSLCAGGLLALSAGPGSAARTHDYSEPPAVQRRLTITDFDATYTIRRDGTIEVIDRITVRFDGSWNGIYRYIPLVYNLGADGKHRIVIDLESIEDASGRSLRYEHKREGALLFMKTWVPGANDATRTLVYKYEVQNGLGFFDGDDGLDWAHDELYWNVTGDEWKMPIRHARATVRLPEGASNVRAVAYTGRRESTAQDYEQSISGSTVTFETTQPLNVREGLTVVVGWDPGLVARPTVARRTNWWLREYPFIPLPLLTFVFMLLLWRRRGRDPELNRSIVPRYEPPKDLRPAEAGTLMDFSVDPNDLSATIIDLAVRGYLRIEEVPGKRRAKDHIIHILKGTEAEGLKDFEREVIKGLDRLASYSSESDTKSVGVSKLKQKFYKYVPEIKRRILDRMVRPPKLFTARPENVIGVWIGIGLVVGAIAVIIGVTGSAKAWGDPIFRWASLIAIPVIVLGFGVFMPARTVKGAFALNHILGLREYIDRVDRDRLKYATLDHFEMLLPFAAAMGLERKWTGAFEGLLTEPPGWYVSAYPGHFHMHGFSRSLGHMTSVAGSALTSAPRQASGGSGFSGGGGGFSGGGFGGGGGGGF